MVFNKIKLRIKTYVMYNLKKINKTIEYVSKDILDLEFIKSFKPMYRFQLLIASSRVDVNDLFVTSPSLIQRCHTIISIVAILVVDYMAFIRKSSLLLVDNSTMFYLSTWVMILQTLTFVCNIIHVRFINSTENTEFVVKQQQIDRCMRIDRNKTITAMMLQGNTFSVAWTMFIFSALLGAASTMQNISFWALLGIVYTQINFVIEIIALSNIFRYFFIRTRFMNCILFNYINNAKSRYRVSSKKGCFTTLFPTKKFMRQLAAETHDFITSETDVYLKEILLGFAMFQAIYRFQVSKLKLQVNSRN